MLNQPLVSVIVPIYNADKYMNKCIDSILKQSLKNIEIILVNDGSTDDSGKLIDDYIKKDSRIKVIHQENTGPSIARNKGISIARGMYIGFVDSDDYIESTMYEELYKLAQKNNTQVAMCSYNEKYMHNNKSEIIKTNLIPDKIYNKDEINNEIISTFAKNDNFGFYSLCNKLYLREWLLESKLNIDTNRDHGEDWWFNINVFTKLDTFVYTNKVLYNYIHTNDNSLMFKYRENQFDLFLDGRLKMKEIISSEYMDYKEFDKRFVYEFSSYIIRTFKEIDDRDKSNQLINRVLDNEEVIDCCKNILELPIHFKITTFLMRYRFKKLSRLTYKFISVLK